MNLLKRALGIFWIALGPLTLYYLIRTGASEMAKKPVIDTKIQWGVFIGISVPIALGIMIFGYYALRGEYGTLPRTPEDNRAQ